MHSSKKLFATTIFNWQGINDVRFTRALGSFACTSIKNIMVDTFIYYAFFRIAFKNYCISNYILCTYTYWFAKCLFGPPKTRIGGSLFLTRSICSVHQADCKLKASFNVLFLFCTVRLPFLSCLGFFLSKRFWS